ncbi:MAG: thermonuclease family protein [Cyanobacteria bacterium J06553_1]
MKLTQTVKTGVLFLFLVFAIAAKISPQWMARLTSTLEPEYSGNSESYTLVAGSIYDGDTFQVSNGAGEIKVRLCGIDAPEKNQALGTNSRNHLRSLISQGGGRVTLVKTDTDQYGRTIAEAFIPTGNGEEEIHLNSQMVADGMAYVYPQYVNSCPNAEPMRIAERSAKSNAVGVWSNPLSEKPWEYRRRSS